MRQLSRYESAPLGGIPVQENSVAAARAHQFDAACGQVAPFWNVAVSDEVNEQALGLANWEQEYNQCSSGRFQGRVAQCAFDGVQIIDEYANQALHQHCAPWRDSLWVGLVDRCEGFRIDGQSVDEREMLWRLGDRSFELVTPERCRILNILVKREELFTFAEREGVDLARLSTSDSLRLASTPPRIAQLAALARRVLTTGEATPNLATHKQALLYHLVALLGQGDVDTGNVPSYAHRRAVVERVRAYVRSSSDTPMSVAALCEVGCVSRRTLQYSFESILGLSPLQFLRAMRLNCVRRRLLSSQSVTVGDAAASQGFFHLSQFAQDYRHLFDERPSDTLKRRLH